MDDKEVFSFKKETEGGKEIFNDDMGLVIGANDKLGMASFVERNDDVVVDDDDDADVANGLIRIEGLVSSSSFGKALE